MNRTLYLENGEKLVIEVNRNAGENNSSRKKKAPLYSSRENEYLVRRKSSQGNVIFYDLGEYLADLGDPGTWTDDNRILQPTASQLTDWADDGENLENLLADEQLEAFNRPLAFDKSEWVSRFRKLNYELITEKYPLFTYFSDTQTENFYLNSANTKFSAAGLKFKDPDYIAFTTFPAFDLNANPFSTQETFYSRYGIHITFQLKKGFETDSYYKVTSIADYGGDEANVQLKNVTTNIFLNRNLFFMRAQMLRFDTENYYPSLDMFFFSFTRAMSFDNEFAVKRLIGDNDSKTAQGDFIKMMSRLDEARQLTLRDNIYTLDTSIDGNFLAGQDSDSGTVLDYGEFRNMPPVLLLPSGALIAVVNQNSNWYFIWKR